MSKGLCKASLSLRVMAKGLDLLLVASAAKMVPQVGLLAGIAYLLFSDSLFDGRSLGKKILSLRVVSVEKGTPATFRDSVVRNMPFAGGVLLMLVPLVGWAFFVFIAILEFLLVLGNTDGMRFGDDIAGTMVVED